MSTIGLIIAFVVYAVIKVASSVNADKAPAAPQPQGEVFPPIEFDEKFESLLDTASVQETAVPAVQRVPKRGSAAAGATAEEPVRDNKVAAPVQKEGRIRIGTASEAKRAFIYSEIFNRKY